jgi:hypothetical protein
MKLKTFVSLFALSTLTTGVSVGLGLNENFSGDLTRTAALPSKAFTPTKAINEIDPSLKLQSAPDKADIVVVGDSFSIGQDWQSVLVAAGYKVHTVHWRELKNGRINLNDWMESRRVKEDSIVVLQIVERNLADKLQLLNEAIDQKAQKIPPEPSPHGIAEKTSTKPDSYNIRMSTGVRLLINKLRMANGESFVSYYPGQSDTTLVSRLETGTPYFSNKNSDWLLTLEQDLKTPAIGQQMIEELVRVHARINRKRLLWLVVPNKSTVYLDTANSKNVPNIPEEIGPNLFKLCSEKKSTVGDLYRPDDTHFSADGYRLVGRQILKALQP